MKNLSFIFRLFLAAAVLFSANMVQSQNTELFVTRSGNIPYRIPAIAKTSNGRLLVVSDYRYCRADIGNGRIDLQLRISGDNGSSWTTAKTIATGDGIMDSQGRNFSLTAGYGDAALVADRESDEVLLVCVCGYQVFPNGTREIPNQVAILRSHNNGNTWSVPKVVTEDFYKPFDENCNHGPIQSLFVGSGKIHQSRYVKVGDYYRIYCSTLSKDRSGNYVNYVYYSDDFGETWKILGEINNPPIPTGANEPKTEELPDGSVVVSSRVTGGRLYNIFRFTDFEKGEGQWMDYASSSSSNNGVVATGNSCNGEIIMVPAVRKADNQTVMLAMQSVPFGNGRTNVGIYYKELSNYEKDYSNPAVFAKDWDGSLQVSDMGSAYSTMVLQDDGKLAFVYEESTYSADYTIIYRPLSVEEITGDAYSVKMDATEADFAPMIIQQLSAQAASLVEKDCVGGVSDEVAGTLRQMAMNSNGTPQSVTDFNKYLATSMTPMVPGKWYRLKNKQYGNYLTAYVATDSYYAGANMNKTNLQQLYSFQPDGDKFFRMTTAQGTKTGITQEKNVNVKTATAENTEEPGLYTVYWDADGFSAVNCINPTHAAYTVLNQTSGNRVVGWNTASDGSKWCMEPAKDFNISISNVGATAKTYPMPVTLPEDLEVYTVNRILDADKDTAVAVLKSIEHSIPANVPIVMRAKRGTYTLTIDTTNDAVAPTDAYADFMGNVEQQAIEGEGLYAWTTLNSNPGFRLRKESSNRVGANTPYIILKGAACNFIRIATEEELLGIESVKAEKTQEKAYDLSGRRTENVRKGQIVITEGGKKKLNLR